MVRLSRYKARAPDSDFDSVDFSPPPKVTTVARQATVEEEKKSVDGDSAGSYSHCKLKLDKKELENNKFQ